MKLEAEKIAKERETHLIQEAVAKEHFEAGKQIAELKTKMEKEKEALRIKIKTQDELKKEEEKNLLTQQKKLTEQFNAEKAKIAFDANK